MDFRVRLTNRAERESEVIYAYIHERSADGANRWYSALLDALDLLKTNPAGRPLAPEGAQFNVDVRQILFKTRKGHTYRALFYVVDDDGLVQVLSVRGPSQDLLTADEIDDAMNQE